MGTLHGAAAHLLPLANGDEGAIFFVLLLAAGAVLLPFLLFLIRRGQEAEADRADRAAEALEAHKRGVAASKAHRIEEALAAFFEAVELDPKRWESWLALADWKGKTGQEKEAQECLERAMAHAPVAERAKIRARLEMIRVRAQQARASPQPPPA